MFSYLFLHPVRCENKDAGPDHLINRDQVMEFISSEDLSTSSTEFRWQVNPVSMQYFKKLPTAVLGFSQLLRGALGT